MQVRAMLMLPPILIASAISLPSFADGDVTTSNTRAKAEDFDATLTIPCAQEVGETAGACDAAVARDAQGGATVVVTFANGFSRILTFADGAFLRGNATMSGVGIDTEWSLSDGTYSIRVDDQRFILPETFVTGQ